MKKQKLKRNVIICFSGAAIITIALWEKRRVDSLIDAVNAAVYDTFKDEFENGWKEGFNFAKENLLPETLHAVKDLALEARYPTLTQ